MLKSSRLPSDRTRARGGEVASWRREGLRLVQMDPLDRISVVPGVCGGQPTIRGLRIPVSLIVRHVADGQTSAQVIAEYPELELEDVRQALLYAAWAAAGRTISIASS